MAKSTKKKTTKIRERTANEAERDAMRARIRRGVQREAAIRQWARTLTRRVREADAALNELADFIARRRAAHAEPTPANLERESAADRF